MDQWIAAAQKAGINDVDLTVYDGKPQAVRMKYHNGRGLCDPYRYTFT